MNEPTLRKNNSWGKGTTEYERSTVLALRSGSTRLARCGYHRDATSDNRLIV